ncbi:magnesium transporter [Brucella pseudogrignonensis]|nr:magnesium transporter [Brucella pseudogrignonensis]
MTTTSAFLYRDGSRGEAVLLDELMPDLGAGTFAWVILDDPTTADMVPLANAFGLHPLAVEDAIDPSHGPKVEFYEEQLLVIAKVAGLEKETLRYRQVAVFIGPHHVIVAQHGQALGSEALRASVEAAPELLKRGTGYALYSILDQIVGSYLPVIEAVEDHVLDTEKHMLTAPLDHAQIAALFGLRRQLILFQRILNPFSDAASKLVDANIPNIDEQAVPYFQDIAYQIMRVENMVDGLWDVVTSVFEVNNLLEQQRQGEINRKLAAWAAIIAVPTAISGIYGMNFANMPELATRFGYPAVLVLMLGISLFLFMRFRQSGWL